MLSDGESATRYRNLQQKLVELKVLEDDFQATLDRAKADRDDASWEMTKAKWALGAKMYREAGLLACEFGSKTAYGKLCVEGNKLLETNQALQECRNGDASGCEKLRGKLNGYAAKGFKKWAPGIEADMAELAVDLDELKSQFKRGDKKAVASSACAISAKLSNWGGPEDLKEKMELACKTGETVATLYEDGKAFLGLFKEAKQLDLVVQANLSQMQGKFDTVKASRQALESQLSALIMAEKEEGTEEDKNCDPSPVVNPELARGDAQAAKRCKPKTTKKDHVCDEILGCPEDESDTNTKDKDLLAKLDADLERIKSGQPGTAGGTLPGESLDAGEDGSSSDKLAMLKSLRAGLGAYRESQQALRDMKKQGKGGTTGDGDIDFSLPPGPCPENLSFLVPRLRSRDPKMHDPALYSVSIRESIKMAGSPGRVIQASRAQVEEFRRALREVAANDGISGEKKRELIDMYKDGIMANEVSARVVECYSRKEGAKGTVRQVPAASQPKGYCGNPYQVDCGNDVECQRMLAAQPKCP